MLRSPRFARGESVIRANTTLPLAALALLGGMLPLTVAGQVASYAAIFRPGWDVGRAVASLSQAGAGWRVMRVLAESPMPILIVAHRSETGGAGGGALPAALLLPVPALPACAFTSLGALSP
jgi:hypothetical protein